jgi:hypothetical protein
MVRRTTLLVCFAIAALLIACGGDDAPGTSSSPRAPAPTARPTRATNGPTASVEPRSGPPGGFVTVTGASWPPGVLIDVTGVLPAGIKADPYATTTTDQSGAFSVRFRLEKTPDGEDLKVGRFDLIIRSPTQEVDLPYLVETKRPIFNNPGG